MAMFLRSLIHPPICWAKPVSSAQQRARFPLPLSTTDGHKGSFLAARPRLREESIHVHIERILFSGHPIPHKLLVRAVSDTDGRVDNQMVARWAYSYYSCHSYIFA
ncbi:hypothetical protein B0T10DRAFT_65858 [Thelonectria olida]|uniref:Uncharacterized protein n=1 Tax=Thelonectria olida TaxID=1576542 RepID=A0A9P8W1R1_9HYPO|nr:hypothetical protein B0T10DRAFT_65858 [Thelonectria olida]